MAANKRRKLSMAEKRKRRARKLPPRRVSGGKPVDFDKYAVETQTQDDDDDDITATATAQTNNNTTERQRAQQLLEAQRKSVDMLTHVRERVEALNLNEIQTSLNDKGYVVQNNFLQRDGIMDEIQSEGIALLKEKDTMVVDLTNWNSGEYVCTIEGGKDQYVTCPRSVEFVVSMTKHLAPALSSSSASASTNNDKLDKLDPSACMATMRTYDRKSQQASRTLLGDDQMPKRRKLSTIVASTNDDDVDDDDDKQQKDARRISILYYPSDGGGITFGRNEEEETVPTKRDCLVILKSDTCLHRREAWTDVAVVDADDADGHGGKQVDNASCIELHLIKG